MTYRAKHAPCSCGCGEMYDECMNGRNPLGAFTITAAIGSATQEPCFYCRRGMHDSCISGETPCRCCVDEVTR